MVDLEIVAVTVDGVAQLEHITHYWTGPSTPVEKQVAVERVWNGDVRYFTRSPIGRTEVDPVPAQRPSSLYELAHARQRGYLRSHRNLLAEDNLLCLPRRPAPTSGFASTPVDTNKLVEALLGGRTGLL